MLVDFLGDERCECHPQRFQVSLEPLGIWRSDCCHALVLASYRQFHRTDPFLRSTLSALLFVDLSDHTAATKSQNPVAHCWLSDSRNCSWLRPMTSPQFRVILDFFG